MELIPDPAQQELQLLERVKDGDREAFNALMGKYIPEMYRYLRFGRYSLSEADVEDVIQDILLKVWKSAGSFQGKGRLASWLRAIAQRTALDRLRKKKWEFVELSEREHSEIPESLEEIAQLEKDFALLDPCIEQLPDAQREVVFLKYVEGGKNPTISKSIGISVNTVKDRLKRALRNLRDCLNKAP